ncbi:MAG: cytochrome c [Anaerolineales bacterium]|nr:cytochrome c [Anaerolineales bacterium]
MKWQIAVGIFLALGLLALTIGLALGELPRMELFKASIDARSVETGAALFENNCRTCHGPQGKGIEGVAPAINAADLYDGSRLAAIGWSGTTDDYLRDVIAAGRPVPSAGSNYPQRMPTWSQRYGGPLRDDQVDSLVAFVMNWKDRALAGGGGAAPPAVVEGAVGTEITVALPAGDPARGQQLAESGLGCPGCHVLAAVGPAWMASGDQPGIGTRAETRFTQDDYTGLAADAQQYLVEAVVQTNAFIVSGYQPNIMPPNYGERLTGQDLADLIAYLTSLR